MLLYLDYSHRVYTQYSVISLFDHPFILCFCSVFTYFRKFTQSSTFCIIFPVQLYAIIFVYFLCITLCVVLYLSYFMQCTYLSDERRNLFHDITNTYDDVGNDIPDKSDDIMWTMLERPVEDIGWTDLVIHVF